MRLSQSLRGRYPELSTATAASKRFSPGHLGRVADKGLDSVRNSRLRRKARDVVRMRRHASDCGHLSAEFLSPENRSAAQAAADVEDFAAEVFGRAPDLGRMPKHELLSINKRPTQLRNRRPLGGAASTSPVW